MEVDATVFDEARRSIRGLTSSEFLLKENGEPRRIVAVNEVVLPDAAHGAPPSSPALDISDNQMAEGRLLVLFIDDATLPLDPAMVKAAKDIALRAVDRMGPTDLMSVVFTGHTSHAQDFTRDRDRLRRAIEQTSVGFDLTGPGVLRLWQGSYNTLLNIAEALRDVPRHRKAVLLVSIGIPGSGSFIRAWRRILQEAPGSPLPIYSFDPSGVGGIETYNTTHPSSRVNASGEALRDSLRAMSSNTGGRAAVVTNTYDEAVDRVFEDTASYYLIGYETPHPPDDGRFRRLEIDTTRPGMSVVARPFFFSKKRSSTESARRSPSTAAFDALAHAIPVQDLPMQAMAAPFASSGRYPAAIAIVVSLRHPVGGKREHRVDLVTGVFEHEGRQEALQRHEATIRLAESASATAVYEITTNVVVKPGRYRLRLGTYNQVLQQSGSIFLDVDVPDFARERLSLSGVVLGSSAAPKQAVVPGMRSILPLAVTTVREFAGSESVTGFLRVYQSRGGAVRPVDLSIRIIDANGAVVGTSDRTLSPNQFSNLRASDVRFPLDLVGLSRGSYTLRIEASASDAATASRAVAFVVR